MYEAPLPKGIHDFEISTEKTNIKLKCFFLQKLNLFQSIFFKFI